MDVIIPMAGRGTRMRPHTHSKPKPLIKVAGKPVLHHILDRILAQVEVEKVVFIISGMEDVIRRSLEGYSFEKVFIMQHELRGDADAIIKARGEVGSEALIVFSDTIFEADLSGLSGNVVWTKQVEDPRSFGVVELDGARIVSVVEKPEVPPSNEAIIGVYYFSEMEKIFSAMDMLYERNITSKGEYRLADAISLLLREEFVVVHRSVDAWLDCGTPQNLLSTNALLIGEGSALPVEGSVVSPRVMYDPSATFVGSVIGDNVSIGRNVRIENCVIRNCIIDDNASISNVVLSDSLIGEDAVLKGSARVVNIGDHSLIDL